MSNTDHLTILAAALMDEYNAHRPTGIPSHIKFLKHITEEGRERPCFVSTTDATNWTHPRLQTGNLIIELLLRTGDATPEDAAAWMTAIEEDFLTLLPATVPAGTRLRWIRPVPLETGPLKDGSFHRITWEIALLKD